MKRLLLPNPETFQSTDKNIPPLVKFYDWVIRTSFPLVTIIYDDLEIKQLLKRIDISKIVIHEDYELKLKEITLKFLKKKYRLTTLAAKKEIPYHFLDIGPSTRTLEIKDKKYVYLEDGFFDKKNKI